MANHENQGLMEKNLPQFFYNAKYAGTCLSLEDESREVFAEDLGRMQLEDDCVKIGEAYYSKLFFQSLETAAVGVEKQSQILIEMAGRFLSDGELPALREVNEVCYALLCSLKTLRQKMEAITLEPNRKAVGNDK